MATPRKFKFYIYELLKYHWYEKTMGSLALIGILVAASAPADTSLITPLMDRPANWECRALVLDQSNAIGVATLPVDQQTVKTRVFYRAGGGRSGKIELRMMRDDARTLETEIAAILRKSRPRSLRFETRVAKGGRCEFFQVTG